jgi:hypothetical protein
MKRKAAVCVMVACQRYWRTVNQAQQYFSSLVHLASDEGLIGQVLGHYPEEILRAADKWADQDADYAERHEDPNRLPFPDPWQFLIDAPAVSKRDRAVFRAAQSQLAALRHLIHIAEGIATLNTDWYQESIKARAKGNQAGYNHAVRKVADGHVIHARVQEDVRKQNNPEMLKQMELLWSKRRAQLVHRGKGAEVKQPKPWPTWDEFRIQNRLPVSLVEWWVRGPNDAPGLMFFRNEALTEFLKFYLDQQNLTVAAVKKARQKLSLIPVGEKKHFVWDYSIKPNGNYCWISVGYQRNGENAFWGELREKPR